MDSTFKVPLTKILRIEEHDNSHSLELAFVYGFQVVVQKGKFIVGDTCVYIPVDSILPNNVENLLFGADAKIKLTKGRLRQIKIRGKFSQGMLVSPSELISIVNLDKVKLESDVSKFLDISKYEPPVREETGLSQRPGSRKALAHPDFHKYNGLLNLKWAPNLFDGKEVVVQEKIHGSNCRAALLPYRANTLMKKIKKFFKLTPEFEYLYGSNNVDITNTKGYSGFYSEDVYGAALNRTNAQFKLEPNEIIFGEVFGPGIQKGYDYGLKEPQFILFDVKRLLPDGTQEWLTPDEVEAYAKERNFALVPILYKGIYNLEMVKQLSQGPSAYCPAEKVREGCVVKVAQDYSLLGNKQALKVVSEIYLADMSNSDNH